MIRKFATLPACRIVLSFFLAVTATHAQQTQPATAQPSPAPQSPAAPTPGSQSSSAQEASDEETTSKRKLKPKDYRNWTFNVGGGASVYNGTTKEFARGGGGVLAAGVARNSSKYLGLRVDFQWDNLPLKSRTLDLAQAPGATNQVYSIMLDPIINIPVNKLWGGYFLVGPAYLHRSGKLDSSTTIPGSPCNTFWRWWGACTNDNLPLGDAFMHSSQNELGFNLGGGVTRKIRDHIELYGEIRYLHGSHSGITTDVRPITIGIRW